MLTVNSLIIWILKQIYFIHGPELFPLVMTKIHFNLSRTKADMTGKLSKINSGETLDLVQIGGGSSKYQQTRQDYIQLLRPMSSSTGVRSSSSRPCLSCPRRRSCGNVRRVSGCTTCLSQPAFIILNKFCTAWV